MGTKEEAGTTRIIRLTKKKDQHTPVIYPDMPDITSFTPIANSYL